MIRILFSMLLMTQIVWAQQPLYHHFDTKDGLSSVNAYRIHAEEQQIWFGTEDGLVKFNGSSFTSYSFLNDSIYNNTVLAICADTSPDYLWISLYENSLYRFHKSSATLTQTIKKSQESGRSIELKQLPNGTLWSINIGYGLYRLQHDSLVHYFPERIVYSTANKGDTLWMACSDGVYYSTFPYNSCELITHTKGIHAVDILLDTLDQSFLVLAQNSIHRLTRDTLISRTLPKQDESFESFVQDRNGNFWIKKKNDGVILWDASQSRVTPITLQPYTNQITQAAIDPFGRIWMTSEGAGLYCFYHVGKVEVFPLSDLYTLAIDQKGGFWGGGFGALYHINNDELDTVYLPMLQRSNQLKWIGQGPQGWMVGGISTSWYREQDSWQVYSPIRGFTGAFTIDSTWYLASLEGLIDEDEYITNTNVTQLFYPFSRIDAIEKDHQGNVWIGSIGKLICVSDHDTLLHPVSTHLKGALVKDLQWVNDTLWMASTAGLYAIHREGYQLQTDLPHPNCRAITVDHENRLWVATERGLFYRVGNQFIQYALDNDEITESPTTLLADRLNTLWVAYPERLVKMKLTDELLHPTFPKMKLSASDCDRSLFDINEDVIYGEQTRTICFTAEALDYNEQAAFTLTYRLLPIDSTWHTTDNLAINFTMLPPGNYQFEARWKHRYTEQLSPTEVYELEIIPTFFQSRTFISLLVISVFLTLTISMLWIIQIMKRKSNQKLAQQEQLHKLHQMALANCLHPHYLTNSLQSLQVFLERNSSAIGAQYLQTFANLIRLNLQDAREPYQSLEKELERLRLFLKLESWHALPPFTYSIEVDDSVEPSEHLIPGMVIQPIVENALWHGVKPLPEGGSISVNISSTENDWLCIQVEDNGSGIQKKAQKGSKISLGTALIREKLDWSACKYRLSYENLSDIDQGQQGTRVTLLIESLLPQLPDSQA